MDLQAAVGKLNITDLHQPGAAVSEPNPEPHPRLGQPQLVSAVKPDVFWGTWGRKMAVCLAQRPREAPGTHFHGFRSNSYVAVEEIFSSVGSQKCRVVLGWDTRL